MIVDADLANREHGAALLELIDAYMRDPMEGGQPPAEEVRRELIAGLRAHPACHVFLAYRGGRAIGFSICFLGFSTFNARPLLNIHDIFVMAEARGSGVGGMLLERIAAKARALNCCRLSLEVREDNLVARGLYRKFGFDRATVGAERVPMEFWWKVL